MGTPGRSRAHANGWWQRNWKWVVPTGCLGALGLFAAFIASVMVIVFAGMKGTEPAKHAFATAVADSNVQRRLGQPLKQGWFVGGSVKTNPSSGEADLRLPISGPRASATLYVVANKHAGKWQYREISVQVDGEAQRMQLLGAATLQP